MNISRAWDGVVRFAVRILGNDDAIVLIPSTRRGEADLVEPFGRWLREDGGHRTVTVPRCCSDFVEVAEEAGVTPTPKRLLLVAHCTETLSALESNPCGKQHPGVLPLRWWERARPYGLVVAFVCRGSTLFTREPWRATFPKWVAFNADLRAFVATPRGEQLWKTVLLEAAKAWAVSATPGAARDRIRAVCFNAMAQMRDARDCMGGDALNMIFLEEWCQSIASSDDAMDQA